MKRATLHRWYVWHKWTSLICTLFLLMLCVTGLPLVFREEIGDWNSLQTEVEEASAAPALSLDAIAAAALKRCPTERIVSMFADDDEPKVVVALRAAQPRDESQRNHILVVHSQTAEILRDSLAPQPPQVKYPALTQFMGIMLSLHKDLFAGLAGELFLAAMGLLFVAAIVTGVVLYAPFMKKLDFGTVRRRQSSRLKWLDLHNLLGIVTTAWLLVVGVTGIFNELSTPLTGLWGLTELPKLLAPYKDKPLPTSAEMVSPQAALDTVKSLMPGKTIRYIAWPGTSFGTSPQHYVLFVRGTTPATHELIVPALVDARTGAFAGTVQLPWYLEALELSRPLHFGDYGGLPLKTFWALLDVVAIFVLGSGVYLWIARRKTRDARLRHLVEVHETGFRMAMPPEVQR